MTFRLIATVLFVQWIATTAKCQGRGAADLPQVLEKPPYGKLIGRVTAVWLRPGDPHWQKNKGEWQMMLVAPFAYEDGNHKKWTAPIGSSTDGASIPKVLWSAAAGTPYTGHYREASVLHDRYCDLPQGNTFRVIARMFYDAMRCEGTGPFEGAVKYYAVLKFGPQDTPGVKRSLPRFVQRISATPEERAFRALIDEAGPKMTDAELASFYAAIEEKPATATKPNVRFVVPQEKVKQLQEIRTEGTLRNSDSELRQERMDTTERAAPGENQFAQLERELARIAKAPSGVELITSDKDNEELLRALHYIGAHKDTITPEQVEQIATGKIPP